MKRVLRTICLLFFTLAVLAGSSSAHTRASLPAEPAPTAAELYVDTLPGSAGGAIGAVVALDKILFFATYNPDNTGLWRSDGTYGHVYKIFNHPVSYLTPVGPWLYFVGYDAVHGSTLWRTNGTIKGTHQVADPIPNGQRGWITDLFALGDRVLMKVYKLEHGAELWVSGGSAATTQLLRDIAPDAQSSNPVVLHHIGAIAYFVAFDGSSTALWRSDGSSSGTFALRTLHSSANVRTVSAVLGDALIFQSGSASTLWRSDGTGDGTVAIGNYGAITHMIDWQRRVYFLTQPDTGGAELWVSDGSTSGTRRVLALADASPALSPVALVASSETIYLSTWHATSGYSLWRSDGTSSGTAPITALSWLPGAATQRAAGAMLYLSASDGMHGSELWRSDGTQAGTVQITAIGSRDVSAGPEYLTLLGDTLYFVADDGRHGRELWRVRLPASAAPGQTLYLPLITAPR
jgi:ELWxxDGT repeat protein